MASDHLSQTFLFTFRCNGSAHGDSLAEVSVEQLADYDPSVAQNAYKRAWFGTESNLPAILNSLGFSAFDVQGVMGALHDHRDADRRFAVTPDQLYAAGFRKVTQVLT